MLDSDLLNHVNAVLSHGLSLRNRLESGEPLRLEAEQTKLRQLLAPLITEELWDTQAAQAFNLDLPETNGPEEAARLTRKAVCCTLTCWIDEFMLQYSALADDWREQPLEAVLYGSNSRNEKFWDEARYAEIRGDIDALEVMYWCVLLGFRGAWRDKPNDWIEAWTGRIGALLDKQAEQVQTPPLDWGLVERQPMPETELPYRRMLFTAMLSLSFVLPVVLLLYWRHLV